MKSYKKMVQKGSLKLRIMGDIIERGTSETWRLSECAKHEKEMIRLLCRALQEAVEEE